MNRRSFCLLSLAPVAVGRHKLVAGARHRAQPTAQVMRRDILSMSAAEVSSFATEVQAMKKNGSWEACARPHETFCATSDPNLQVHFGWWFLPWHRAYLAAVESVLQRTLGPNFALPYWDWTSNPRLPAPFAQQTSPLFDSSRQVSAQEELPSSFVDVSSAMRANTFESFGGHRPPSGTGQAARPGRLEVGAHNNVHSWVGGNMGAFDTAAVDPLFYLHHCNVDRLWYEWQSMPGSPPPPPDTEFRNRQFQFFDGAERVTTTVEAQLNVAALSYRYASPGGSQETSNGDPRQPLAIAALPVSSARLPISEGVKAAMRPGSAQRVVVTFEVRQQSAGSTALNVFVNRPEADSRTPTSDTRFVGTVSLVPLRRGAVNDRAITVELDITEVASIIGADNGLRMRFVPVHATGRAAAADAPSITVSNVSVLAR
jgi:hypothetical protein